MRRAVARWSQAARSVGSALLEVLAAEAAELKRDLAMSGRALRGGLVLFAVAAAVAFWSVGLALWLLVELLRARLSAAGALLVVLACAVLCTALLSWLGKRRLGAIESPVETFKRRGREHAEWWQQAVLPGLGGDVEDDGSAPAGEVSDADDSST